MTQTYNVPGVYKQDVFLRAQSGLMTGIAGFVGFCDPPGKAGDVESSALFNKLVTGSAGDAAFKEPLALLRKDDFLARVKSGTRSYLADTVSGFFLNGGALCYVVFAEWSNDAETREEALTAALRRLAPLTDLDLVAFPDAMILDENSAIRAQAQVLQHCAVNGGRFAILDALPTADPLKVIEQRKAIAEGLSEPVNGALYYPWLKTTDGRTLIPPCGHVAGIFSRSDAANGVFKAPANEEVSGALDLGVKDPAGTDTSVIIGNRIQDQLNPEGVNCLRAFPGRGIRVWGARTLSSDPIWRYVNVRRLFLTLQHWIDLNMGWTNFEPNVPQLWVRITRELSSYLSELWRAGGLAGRTADEAFYIKCDRDTNPPETLEAGQTITEIGLAPSVPAEFIVVRVVHHTAVAPR
jgi:phage tail sheath protein FI